MALIDRIEERLQATGLSAAAACKKAGVSIDIIRNLRRGTSKSANGSTIIALAVVLKTSVAFLMGQTEDPSPNNDSVQLEFVRGEYLPVLYEVGDDYWIREGQERVNEPPALMVAPLPKYSGCKQWLERVIGASALPLYTAGMLIHVVSAGDIGYRPMVGDKVVVRTVLNGRVERSIQMIAKLADGSNGPKRINETPDSLADDARASEISISGKIIGRYNIED